MCFGKCIQITHCTLRRDGTGQRRYLLFQQILCFLFLDCDASKRSAKTLLLSCYSQTKKVKECTLSKSCGSIFNEMFSFLLRTIRLRGLSISSDGMFDDTIEF
jgi:hypothetical protein